MPSQPLSPEVTVVIPTLNRGGRLERSVHTAFAQDAGVSEVVVVNDGGQPVHSRIAGRPGLRVVDHPVRKGVSAARNSGVQAATTDWVAFLDDDDLWAPDHVSELLDALRRGQADFAYASALTVDEQLRPVFLQPATAPDAVLETLMRWNAVPGGGSGVVARTALVRELDGFDETLSFAADWDMWIRLAQAGRPCAVQRPLTAYVHGSESWVLSGDPAIHRDLDSIERKHSAIAAGFGVRLDRNAFERYLATSLWFAGRRRDAVKGFLAVARRHRDPIALAHGLRAFLPVRRTKLLRRSALPDPDWLAGYREAFAGG